MTYFNYFIPQKINQILATVPPIAAALVREYRKLLLCKEIISISTHTNFFFVLFIAAYYSLDFETADSSLNMTQISFLVKLILTNSTCTITK